MTKNIIRLVILLAAIFLGSLPGAGQSMKSHGYGFIENKGQIVDVSYNTNSKVLFLLSSHGMNVQLRSTGFSYDIYTIEKTTLVNAQPGKFNFPGEQVTWHFSRVDIELEGCNPNAKIEPREKSTDYINYYTAGTPTEGVLNVHHYAEVYYQNIYNGIDLQFTIASGRPKYNFILSPGADINDIKFRLNGADKNQLSDKGNILISTAQGTVSESIPYSYYGKNSKTDIRFISLGENTYGFAGDYPKNQRLVIDPTPYREWATYFGGTLEEGGTGISNDLSGNVYLCGYTLSTSGIATSGSHQSAIAGNYDAYLAKFDTATGHLSWATYYGGTSVSGGEDFATAVCTDPSSNIYMSGYTASPNNIGYKGFRDTLAKLYDAFLVKFNTNGIRLWGTYYGGLGDDKGWSVATDKNGLVYLAGDTRSATLISFNGYQNTFSSSSSISDGFLVKFDSSGGRIWATYFGGVNDDKIYGVCTDINGNIVITGSTQSTSSIFYHGHQSSYGGATDAFISKFTPSGVLLWSTFYGGTSSDIGYAVTADKDSNIYVAGNTSSTSGIYYLGFDASVSGQDAFLAKLTAAGIRKWATYYGGTASEEGKCLSNDPSGNIYLGGVANSTSSIAAFGYQNAKGSTSSNSPDAFAVRFNPEGLREWGTYYGGSGNDYGYGVVVQGESIFLAGTTGTTGSVMSTGSHQLFLAGSTDAFLVRFENNEIIATVPKGPFCGGDTFLIPFRYTGIRGFSSGNIFYAELSDASGNFSGVTIGGKASRNSVDTIKATIPFDKSASGQYRIRVFSTDSVYGLMSDSFTIRANPAVFFSVNDSTQCFKNHNFIFNGTIVGTPPYTINWDFGDSSFSSINSPTKKYVAPGVYKVQMKVGGVNYVCTSAYQIFAKVYSEPDAQFTVSDDTICKNDTAYFTDGSSAPSGATLNYAWSFGDGGTSTTKDAKHKYTSVNKYNVWLIVISSASFGSCKDTAVKTIVASALPTAGFTVNKSTQCLTGNNFTFTNSSTISSGTLRYEWTFGSLDSSTATNPVKSFSFAGPLNTVLKAISTASGCSAIQSQALLVNPNPVAAFTINDSTQCLAGNGFSFTNSSSIVGGGTLTYTWLISGSTYTAATPPLIGQATTGTKTARLTARATSGCSDSLTKNFYVYANPANLTVSGPAASKGKAQETYSVSQTTGSTYSWAVSGGTIVSGQGSNSINVRWDENSGSVGKTAVTETNSNGCIGTTADMFVDLAPSSAREVNPFRITIYPNPANGRFSIDVGSYTGAYTVKMTNNLGQTVLEQKGEGPLTIDAGLLPTGIYFVQLSGEGLLLTEKIIIIQR